MKRLGILSVMGKTQGLWKEHEARVTNCIRYHKRGLLFTGFPATNETGISETFSVSEKNPRVWKKFYICQLKTVNLQGFIHKIW